MIESFKLAIYLFRQELIKYLTVHVYDVMMMIG